jgi:hypothetical protein
LAVPHRAQGWGKLSKVQTGTIPYLEHGCGPALPIAVVSHFLKANFLVRRVHVSMLISSIFFSNLVFFGMVAVK